MCPDLATPRGAAEIMPSLRAINERFQETHGVALRTVVVDTLLAAAAIQDENSNSEAGKVIRNLRTIINELDVTLLAVTHTGKNEASGVRGASAWRAGADSVLIISAYRDEKTGHVSDRTIALTKSRVGAEGWNAGFSLTLVKLGETENGDDFCACIIDPGQAADHPAVVSIRQKKLSGAAKMFIDSVSALLRKHGKKLNPFGPDGLQVFALDLELVRAEVYARKAATGDQVTKQDTRRKFFDRGLQAAIDAGRIGSREVEDVHYVWLVRENS